MTPKIKLKKQNGKQEVEKVSIRHHTGDKGHVIILKIIQNNFNIIIAFDEMTWGNGVLPKKIT